MLIRLAVYPFADIPCKDPIEAVLDEADRCNVKVFLGNGFYGNWQTAAVNIVDEGVIGRSFRAMEELAARLSFWGTRRQRLSLVPAASSQSGGNLPPTYQPEKRENRIISLWVKL